MPISAGHGTFVVPVYTPFKTQVRHFRVVLAGSVKEKKRKKKDPYAAKVIG